MMDLAEVNELAPLISVNLINFIFSSSVVLNKENVDARRDIMHTNRERCK